MLVGHPFNPPHLIPLVEVVPGERTTEEVLVRCLDLYRALGKTPIRVRREVPGHVANRLQAALWREAFALVGSGVATVEDIDVVMTSAIGPRWTVLGPFATLALSGGDGGMAALLQKLGPAIDEWWGDLSDVRMTPELAQTVSDQTEAHLAGSPLAELAQARDSRLPAALGLRIELD